MVRGLVYRVWYWRVQDAVQVVQVSGVLLDCGRVEEIVSCHVAVFLATLQSFGRMVIHRRKYQRRVAAVRATQVFLRFSALRMWFRKKTKAVNCIKDAMMSYLRTCKINEWFAQMDRACRLGDLESCERLMRRESRFESLRKMCGAFLVNMRDQVCVPHTHIIWQLSWLCGFLTCRFRCDRCTLRH